MGADDVWPPIVDGLVRGVHHELNNRVASLSAVEQVIASGAEMTPALRGALVSELARMRGAIALLGRIPEARPGRAAAFRLQDLLSSSLELARLHHELRDLDVELACPDDLPPVRADPAALERAVLVLIAAAARSSSDGHGGPLRLHCSNNAGRVGIRFDPVETTEAERHAIAAWLRPSDGDIDRTGSRAYSIRIPALTAAPA